MRVLHLYKDAYPPTVGGIERHIYAIRNALPEIRQDVLVCAREPRTRVMCAPIGRHGIDVLVAEFGRVLSTPIAPSYPLWLRRLARGAVVHIHMPNPLAEVSVIMLPASSRIVATYHADVYRQRHLIPLYGPLVRRCLRRADAIVTGSERLRDASPLLRSAGVTPQVVPYAIDVDRWSREGTDEHLVAELRAAHDGPFVLAVGRLVSYKGFDGLIRAARDLPWKVVIVGDGPMRRSLEDQTRALGVARRVYLAGRLDDDTLRAYFGAAGIFVLPSVNRAEAFGVVLLEAQAAGVPVVVTDTGSGTPEAFDPGRSGTLVPAGDEEALVTAILELIESPARRAEFGAAGRTRVRERNSLEALASRLGPLYRAAAHA